MTRACLALALFLTACSHEHVHRGAAGVSCPSDCRADQYCYVDGDTAVSIDNPRCVLLPTVCTKQPDCACLVQQVKATVCDDTGATPQLTYYAE